MLSKTTKVMFIALSLLLLVCVPVFGQEGPMSVYRSANVYRNAYVISVEKSTIYSGWMLGIDTILIETEDGRNETVYRLTGYITYPEEGRRYDLYYFVTDVEGTSRCENTEEVPLKLLLLYLPSGKAGSAQPLTTEARYSLIQNIIALEPMESTNAPATHKIIEELDKNGVFSGVRAVRTSSISQCQFLIDWAPDYDALLEDDEVHAKKATSYFGLVGPAAAPTVPAIIEWFGASIEAIDALQWIGPGAASAVPLLMHALEDIVDIPHVYERFALVHALGYIGPAAASAVPLLIEETLRGNNSRKADAIVALGLIGPGAAPAVPRLIELMKDDICKDIVIDTLGLIGPGAAQAVPALIEALEGRERCSAASSIGMIGPGAIMAVPALIEALNDAPDASDARERIAIVWALGMIGPGASSSVPILVESLEHDPDKNVRFNAARALGNIGPLALEAIPSLTQALKDESEDVRLEAIDALVAILSSAPPELIDFAEKWAKTKM